MTLCGNHFALTILFRSEFLVIFTQSNQTFWSFLGGMERTADSFESIKGPNQNSEDARWSRLIATLVKKRQIKRIHFSTCSQWTRVAELSIGKTEWYFQLGKLSENLICSERFLSGHDYVLSVVCQGRKGVQRKFLSKIFLVRGRKYLPIRFRCVCGSSIGWLNTTVGFFASPLSLA